MLISVKNLRKLKPGLCFALNQEGYVDIVKYDEKNPPSGVLMAKTPRVRMLGTRLGDEKSNSYKDIKAEFSWHEFPRWAFYIDLDMLKIGFGEYRLSNLDDSVDSFSEPVFS